MSHTSQRPSETAYHIEDCQISTVPPLLSALPSEVPHLHTKPGL